MHYDTGIIVCCMMLLHDVIDHKVKLKLAMIELIQKMLAELCS